MGLFSRKPNVERLIKALKDEDFHVRIEAAEALGKIGDERAVEPLIEALKDKYDKDRGVRMIAARALGEIGEPAVGPLIEALKDKDNYVRRDAAGALGEISWQPKDDVEKAYYLIAKEQWDELVKLGKPAVEPLIEALKDKYWPVQSGAARVLGKIGDARAVEQLIETLRDGNEGVRAWAGDALVKIGEPAVEPLNGVLKDPDRDFRWRAAGVLLKIQELKIVGQ
ncbi:HEAT repeat domain-containing protein [Candidatus Bathyarchaeota archaeon]|nr:HEAT repeat domain-containing protein [Candidatus Bathyarchaeota archaeon]